MALRVAYITHYPELYGANRSMLDLLLELRDRGAVEPFVVMPRSGPLVDLLAAERIPSAVIPFEPWMTERYYGGRWYHRLAQHLRHEASARKRSRATAAAVPVMAERLRSWGVQLIHANSAVVPGLPELRRALGVPLVWHIRELPERQYGLYLDAGAKGFGRALRAADRVVAISAAVEDDIRRYAGGTRNVVRIFDGVLHAADYDRLARPASPAPHGPFTFLIMGLIHPSKGQVEAVEALALLRDRGINARLVIAGSGRDKPLRRRIDELGLHDRVELPGFVKDPFPLFRSADAYLMCSRHEAFGRVTVEAMACGLPVVGHASGGTAELIQDGRTGLLYATGAAELADRMARLVGDPALAEGLGRAGAADARHRFTIEQYAQELLAEYRGLCPEGPARSAAPSLP